MIDYGEIDREIDSLEHGKTTYSAIEKLALLYVVRDHNNTVIDDTMTYSETDAPVSTSEFIEVAKNVDKDALLSVLDEHMNAVSTLYPREYEAVLRRIKALT